MRLPSEDEASVADMTGSAGPELLNVVPTRGRSPNANRLRGWVWLAARLLGALAVLATGAVHLYEFEHLYSQIPTIGTLFFLDFLGATAIGLGLLAPVERVAGRHGSMLVVLALAGIALAAIAFVFLLISEQTPLLAFKSPATTPPESRRRARQKSRRCSPWARSWLDASA
jgi:hypothetical protein